VKPFLFAIARNLAIDRIRRSRIVSIEPAGDSDILNVIIDEVSPERRLNARQELRQLGNAFGLLPPKCREVIWLRKVDALSQAEVAQRLGISVRTVEFHIQKGMRILARALFGEGGVLRSMQDHRERAHRMSDSAGNELEDGQ
jgi:RNA polymerase sigma-70 factor (ECF subfamily)